MTDNTQTALARQGGERCIHATAHAALAGCTNSRKTVLWSNLLIEAPAVYSLMERRLLYYLTLQIKQRFTERNLGVPDTWKDLYFHMTDEDLGNIGGRTNIMQTYEALCGVGEKLVSVTLVNDEGQLIDGKVHWVDSFFYNADTKRYDVRLSPEIMPYLINLTKKFTAFDAIAAMALSSKFSQKFYEIRCQYSGDYTFITPQGVRYKPNVIPIDMDTFKRIFGLNEVRDARTGKIIQEGKYKNFNDISRRVIIPAQKELYKHYIEGMCDVWFDYDISGKNGRRVEGVDIYVYSRTKPKEGICRPWQEGDEPLCPIDTTEDKPAVINVDIVNDAMWDTCTTEQLERMCEAVLNRYLKKDETWHYLTFIHQNRNNNRRDALLQLLQVVREKECQPKFQQGTTAYKRKAIMKYALQDNLLPYGWSCPMPKKEKLKQ